jgi:hypothetical protein
MLFSDDEMLAAFVFGLVKLVAYYFFVRRVARAYAPRKVALPLIVALARIALGAVLAFVVATTFDVHRTWSWYLVLVLLRAIEWGVVFTLFYEQTLTTIDWRRLAKHTALGALLSCLLDLPAGFSAIAIPIMAYGIC